MPADTYHKKGGIKLKLIKLINTVLFLFFGYVFQCSAQINIENKQHIEFGKLLLFKQNAIANMSQVAELTTDGAYISNSNISNAGIVNFSLSDNQIINIKLDVLNAGFSVDNISKCSMDASNVVASESLITLNENSVSKDVSIGLTLNINGYCSAGKYAGTITIPYLLTDENNQEIESETPQINLNFSIEIDEPLTIEKKSDLSFGIIISPKQNGTVVISPEGKVTLNNVDKIKNNDVSVGSVLVKGINGRAVNLELENKSIELINDTEDTMIVDNFVFSTNKNFILTGDGAEVSKNLYIGATLNVNANQPKGIYSGVVMIKVFY